MPAPLGKPEMLKIRFEDEDLEEFSLGGDADIAVPISVSESADGEREITVYSRFEREAEVFARAYGDDPFSNEAKEYLDATFSPIMERYGFEYEREYDQTVVTYTAAHGVAAPTIPAELLDTNEKLSRYFFPSARDFEVDDDDPCDVVFAVTEEDRALSFAAVNDYSDDGSLEINVETSPDYRGRGYATAVTSAIARHLLSRGERVTYRCRASNLPSRRVAEKAGLVYSGRIYNFVCYKK